IRPHRGLIAAIAAKRTVKGLAAVIGFSANAVYAWGSIRKRAGSCREFFSVDGDVALPRCAESKRNHYTCRGHPGFLLRQLADIEVYVLECEEGQQTRDHQEW